MFIINLLKKIFYKVTSIFYVGATDMLPEPLSKEMEDYYINLKDDGDLKAKDILIEHNLRLVVFLAKKYENTGVDLEDLVSIGTIGLIKGINTFSKEKNIKLATYASRCIDNEILMYLRKNKRIKSEVSIDASLSFDVDGNELHLEDVLGTDSDIVTKGIEEETERNLMINEVMRLRPRDRDIMILRYGLLGHDELTQKEVAEKLGISQSYISRIEKKVIKRLKMLVNYN
ncbi:MAG: RNA polymerase sporulation sigma factor SigK [Bacilli bacterium]|nr:RNA polymerase sporulation sigma factor SigK [Mycoplasmatota bacterium]MDD6941655.1 RNA polymerase sporulation sigma factor SigK [bacterium]MDY2697367.1 RNA polymerase sporulation sigma factor SigK [Bacilli bacterium]MDY5992586.1 RNA polymerase sporulation sigma factor SigK [Bacilli bacterium]MEE0015079.1 RNA polymerase sporulation sigma factor SigK [Bacilli bacterium]